MIDFPVAAYLAYARSLKPEEEALRQEADEWLPETIIDCHHHANLEAHVGFVNDRAKAHMLSTFPYLSIEDSIELQNLFFPNRTVRTLRFPKTYRGLDHRAANQYLLDESPQADRIAVFGLPEDVDYTTGIMQHPRASALKMYWSYVDPPAEKIYDFFIPEILEEAQHLDLPIILHLPKVIVKTSDDLLQLLSDFPRLRVVLAHLGLSKLPIPGLQEAYEMVAARSDNVWLDTALNPSAAVTEMAINCFGSDRILFGSDAPLNMIRSVAYQHPERGERIVTDYPYHWVDPEEYKVYGHLAASAVHAQWQCTRAVREAVEAFTVSERKQLLNQIFHDNAKAVFGF